MEIGNYIDLNQAGLGKNSFLKINIVNSRDVFSSAPESIKLNILKYIRAIIYSYYRYDTYTFR